MDDIKAKQQVVEKIKEASKILVTVSNSPSVDALSAALGLTLLFERQEKYATAIFSGETPPAIAFLEPEKTFDETTDSLRDFIIALDKEKADHLRYKIEGDAVKIFITPYKTTITQKDLDFSQGDYNVELVVALGVDSQENLDQALENHGQILHDATVITVSAGDQTSKLGGIDWHDASASSLSEMVAGLAEALKTDKKKSLINAPIATALLTGIVAETDRFSNQHTTSRAMTVAAQLMVAGADQQLISTELEKENIVIEPFVEETVEAADAISEDGSQGNISIRKDELSISHDTETLAELDERVRGMDDVAETEAPVEVVVSPAPGVPEVPASNTVTSMYELDDEAEPSFGGTLNATTEQAADDARRAALSDQNKTILSHAYLGGDQAPSVGDSTTAAFPGTPSVAPGSVGVNVPAEEVHPVYSFNGGTDNATPAAAPTFGVGGEKVIQPLVPEPVTQEVQSAPVFEPVATPFVPASPVDLGLPLPPPLPDFSQGPLAPPSALPPVFPVVPAPTSAYDAPAQPEILGDILAPEAPQPSSAYAFEPIETPVPGLKPTPPAAPAPPNDPGQFHIPSQ